jgi:hypothetical protein
LITKHINWFQQPLCCELFVLSRQEIVLSKQHFKRTMCVCKGIGIAISNKM